MLPDLPILKEKLSQRQLDFFEKQIAFHSGSFTRQMPKRILHEGNGFVIEYEDGSISENDMRRMHSQASFNAQELLKNPEDVFRQLDEMAKAHAMQETQLVIEKITEATERVGNVTKSRGEITPDDIFDALSKIVIDFNNDGTPRMPVIWGGEWAMKSFPKAFEEIKNDATLTKRLNDIMIKQKEAWYDRKINRKLVD